MGFASLLLTSSTERVPAFSKSPSCLCGAPHLPVNTCFQMAGLKFKAKILEERVPFVTPPQRAGLHTNERSARHKNVPCTWIQCCEYHVHSTKSASEMSICCCCCCCCTGQIRTTEAAAEMFLKQTGHVISLPSYLAETRRSSSSRSCTATVPETLPTGDWQPPRGGAQTSFQHFKGGSKLFPSKGSN